MMRTVAAITLALLTNSIVAKTPLKLTPRERDAFEYLHAATQFEAEKVGFAAQPSHGYIAFRILAHSEDASSAFDELLSSGTSAAKIYALIGIRHGDPVRFNTEAWQFRTDDREVGYFVGCVMGKEPMSSLVRDIDGKLYSSAFEADAGTDVRKAERDYDFKRQP